MSRAERRLRWLLLSTAWAAACADAGSDGPRDAGGEPAATADAGVTASDDLDAGEPAPTYAPTLAAIHREILRPSCAWIFCHGGDDLLVNLRTPELSYETMVNQPAEGADCRDMGLIRVVPGDPESSLLYVKITEPTCGDRMPLHPDYNGMLAEAEIAQIREWIELGAPAD